MFRSRSRRKRDALAVNAEINLVNLVDLAFVLLIIFMITAPIMQGGVEVSLPKAAAAPLPQDENALVVTLDRTGAIYIGEVRTSGLDEFERVFPSHMQARENKTVYLKGDKDVRYGEVMRLMGRMNKAGVADVGMVVDPETER